MEKLSEEDRILLVTITKLEEPHLWYKDHIGGTLQAIDFRYESKYKIIDADGNRLGYVTKSCCEIARVIKDREVPDFPFQVKITQNTWSDRCWYKNKIGMEFTIVNGSPTEEWLVKGEQYNIQKKDCVILKPGKPLYYRRHITGGFVDYQQKCIICGEVLLNYQGAIWPNDSPPPMGFAAGSQVYISSGSPKVFCTTISDNELSEDCYPGQK